MTENLHLLFVNFEFLVSILVALMTFFNAGQHAEKLSNRQMVAQIGGVFSCIQYEEK